MDSRTFLSKQRRLCMARKGRSGSLRRGRLVKKESDWFIETETGSRFPLPLNKQPIEVCCRGPGMIAFTWRLSGAGRQEGDVILFRTRRHGDQCWVKYWGHCPRKLISSPSIIQLSFRRTKPRPHRHGPHLMLSKAS